MIMRIYSKLNLETEHLAAAAEQAVRGKHKSSRTRQS
jgi:hypothetical protein